MQTVKIFNPGLLTLVILCTHFLPAFADSNSTTMMQLLKILHKNGTIDDSTYKILQKSEMSEDVVVAIKKTPDTNETAKKIQDIVHTSIADGNLKFKTDSEDFSLQLGGRLMVDAVTLKYRTELRRARIFSKGTFWHDWHFKAQYDFASDKSKIKDAWIAYSGLDNYLPVSLNIKFGNHKESFGLEALTSTKHTTFMERSLLNVFAPGRNIGLSASTYGKNWTISAGIFGNGVDDTNDSDKNYAFASRATFAPFYNPTRVLHLGASIEYRQLKTQNLKINQRPESHIANSLIYTENFMAYDSTKWGAEIATVIGAFSLQSEYIDAIYNTEKNSKINFNGWYSYASWFLSGESRNYKASTGIFSRVKPKSIVGKGGYGAWELGIRYSALNLNDGTIKGGREDNITLGLNWYATTNIRFMANYIFANSKRYGQENDLEIFQLRSQIDF